MRACRTHGRSELIEDTCNGVRRVWRDQQIKRTVDILHAKPLPYIVKLQQAMGGAGTLWIKTDKELVEVTRHISDVSLRNYLPRLDATNLHLKPVNLLLSDVIEGETRGNSWFIKKKRGFGLHSSVGAHSPGLRVPTE